MNLSASEDLTVARGSEGNWADLYRAGLLEIDRSKLPNRIAEAEKAIRERLWQLGSSEDRREERQALLDALRNLEVLRRFYC
jgi:hypothetical protein